MKNKFSGVRPLFGPSGHAESFAAEGHTATVSVTATITDIGKVENRISSIVIRDENGLNVSKNYNVSFRFGTLEILPD